MKIVLIYVTVAVVGAAVLGTSMWISKARKERFRVKEVALAVGKDEPKVKLTLENDLQAVNQDGEEVKLSDLEDKVWLAAQFFASCPQCAKRNYEDLSKIYDEFGGEDGFHMVCITVDPEYDTVERLGEYSGALNADSENWWFLTGDRDTVRRYLVDEMKFLEMEERTDPQEAAEKGKYRHDLGLELYGPGMRLLKKVDLAYARTQTQADYNFAFGELQRRIREALEETR
ncbi:MAG: redoxin domain-containing protein [Akkermansiaceae bacterium]|nr:redoxin domain-containing protein [Akkermansiaceae bacterium]